MVRVVRVVVQATQLTRLVARSPPPLRHRYYNQNRFYRVLPDWVCQWGVNGNPDISAAWSDQFLPDDVVRASNTKGAVAFSAAYSADRKWATNRTTELYINYHSACRYARMSPPPRHCSG